VSSIASGSTVALGMAMSQRPSLLAALAARASAGDIDALKVYYFHAESFLSKTLLKYELMGQIQPHCMFLGEPERKLIRQGTEDGDLDESGSNLAALEAINAQRNKPIKIRQNKYLTNLIEQDHRAIKRRTRPMLGFKTVRCARIVLGGIELMHMNKKGQMEGTSQTPAEQFYSLAK
jgi:hypothetical protein